jgi:hypothetical protein
MRRGRLRIWVVMMREEDGLAVWICEPLRKKEIQKRLDKGWKLYG